MSNNFGFGSNFPDHSSSDSSFADCMDFPADCAARADLDYSWTLLSRWLLTYFIWIFERVVGFIDLFEFLCEGWVDIGMVLLG